MHRETYMLVFAADRSHTHVWGEGFTVSCWRGTTEPRTHPLRPGMVSTRVGRPGPLRPLRTALPRGQADTPAVGSTTHFSVHPAGCLRSSHRCRSQGTAPPPTHEPCSVSQHELPHPAPGTHPWGEVSLQHTTLDHQMTVIPHSHVVKAQACAKGDG